MSTGTAVAVEAALLGRREIDYLGKLEANARRQTMEGICKGEVITIIVAEDLEPPVLLVECAERAGVPLLKSRENSQHVINVLRPYMQQELGEITTLHGVMLDVLELGVLITGDSSIGKSELALELISRGHGLVADDVVELQQIGPDTIQSRCPPMKSSKTFCFLRSIPALCQSSPYSPPPRRFATA